MNEREALKLALDVFGGNDWHEEIVDLAWADKANTAITAIKDALAQPEQEPVARYFEQYQGKPIEEIDEERFNQTPDECRFKLYTAPPQPEPVIDKSAALRSER